MIPKDCKRLAEVDFPKRTMILYFAYGSNLNCCQLRSRCPSCQFVCRAVLKDHVLAFTRFSTGRQCGVADVVAKPGHDVWGVVYQIDERDLRELDRIEGFRPDRGPEENSYNRREVSVLREGDINRALTVATYVATKQNDWTPPSQTYLGKIIEEARFWGFPHEYREGLEQFRQRISRR